MTTTPNRSLLDNMSAEEEREARAALREVASVLIAVLERLQKDPEAFLTFCTLTGLECDHKMEVSTQNQPSPSADS